MTPGDVWTWTIIAVNLAAAGMNLVSVRRYRRAAARANEVINLGEAQAVKCQEVLDNFMQRLTTGEVLVTTDDGVSGTLTIIPEGDTNVRIYVNPQAPVHVH